MDAMWANAIPLVTLLGVVFGAGLIVAEVKAIRRDLRSYKEEGEKNVQAIREDLGSKLGELKKDFYESAQSQGKRLGELEAEQRAKARADDVRRELTGRYQPGIPSEVK